MASDSDRPRTLRPPRALHASAFGALLGLTALAACGAADDAPLEDADPRALTWVAPTTATAIAVGEPVELAVATQHPEARAVSFRVDGREVFVCDPAQPGEDCRRDEMYRYTTVFATPGEHALMATFVIASGATVETPPRAVTVLAEAPADPEDPELDGTSDEPDPVPVEDLIDEGAHDFDVSFIVNAVVGPRGYLDPSRRTHSVFGGRAWSVRGQRVVLEDARLDGSVGVVTACMERHGTSIERYADAHLVSRGSVVAALIAASECGTGDAPTRGLAGLTASSCAAIARIDRAACRDRMASSPDFAIETAVRYLASGYQRRQHRSDPPRMAATYATGALRRSRRNAWAMAAPGNYLDRFVAAYNAYRTWERRVEEAALGRGTAPASRDAPWRYGGGQGYPRIPARSGATVVATRAELEAALAAATRGTVVYVDDDARIDLTGASLCIPAGVTLASGRGRNGSNGARLYVTSNTSLRTLRACGDHVRVTSLRLDGGDPDLCPPGAAWPCGDLPVALGIQALGFDDLEVDNCELSGWSGAAVDVTNSRNNRVHHNYIHHNRREHRGYGVVLGLASSPTDVLVEWNRFDYNRHSIAGSGAPGLRYEARYNLVLPHASAHVFDMHNHGESPHIPDEVEVAGTRFRIHHNTILPQDEFAVRIRGRPEQGVWIYGNCFARRDAERAVAQVNRFGNFFVDRAPWGPAPNRYNRTCRQCESERVCDSF